MNNKQKDTLNQENNNQMELDKKDLLDHEDEDENLDNANIVEIEFKEGGDEDNDNMDDDPETEEEKKIRTDEEEKLIKREFDFRTDGEIYSLDIFEKKGLAFIGDGEETFYVYDLDNKKLLAKDKLHSDSIAFIKISSDQKFIATAGLEGTVKIWDFEDMINNNKFTLLNKYENTNSEINFLDWHPKGPVVSIGTEEGSSWVYHAKNINSFMSFFGHADSISCGGFTPDGKYLCTGSMDLTLRVWDLKNEKLLHTIKDRKKFHSAGITSLCLSKTKSIVVTGSLENEIAISNFESGNIIFYCQLSEEKSSIEAIDFCMNDNFIAIGGVEGVIYILDTGKLNVRNKITINEEITKIQSSKIYPHIIYVSTYMGNIYIYDLRGNGECVIQEKLHTEAIMDFSLTKNENFIITSSLDKSINMLKLNGLLR